MEEGYYCDKDHLYNDGTQLSVLRSTKKDQDHNQWFHPPAYQNAVCYQCKNTQEGRRRYHVCCEAVSRSRLQLSGLCQSMLVSVIMV
jgi:hypothetical protein